MFERYVNFEFYKTEMPNWCEGYLFERYVNFEFYKTVVIKLKNNAPFERYVNFEFYETYNTAKIKMVCLRDM